MTASSAGVEIPDQFLLTGKRLIAYIVVVDGEAVNTVGQITFPVNVRGRRTDISPEPVEQQQIDSLIDALSSGVTRVETAASEAEETATEVGFDADRAETAAENAASSATDAVNAKRDAKTAQTNAETAARRAEDALEEFTTPTASANTLSHDTPATADYANGHFTFGIPEGEDGVSPTVTVVDIQGGHKVTITDEKGEHVFDVMDGVGDVQDVQINGTSILDDGVANIPIADAYHLGVIKVNYIYGHQVQNGILVHKPAAVSTLKAGRDTTDPVVSSNAHPAAFYGLAKAAGDTTQSQSSNPVGTYTEDAKSAIHEMLNGSVAVSGTTPTIVAKSGITYVCGEVATLDITPPASGIFEVQFVSGSTPTVLTATGVSWVNGFDPTALEANKTYDISISNGIGVAVWI